MSIRAKNVGIDELRYFNKNLYLSSYLEAPPHLTEFRIKITISGSRSETVGAITRNETLSYSKELTFTRVPMNLGTSVTANPYDGYDIAEIDGILPSGAEECYIFQPSIGTDDFIVSPHAAKAYIEILYENTFTPEICGSWEYIDADTPANDDSGDINIALFPLIGFSEFVGSFEYRSLPTRWGAIFGSPDPPSYFGGVSYTGDPYVDITGWDALDWRDKRGIQTYTLTETEWGSGTSDVTYEVEWELS